MSDSKARLSETLDFLKSLSLELVDEALSLSSSAFQTSYKDDNSPVTTVDIALSRSILSKLSKKFPKDIVISEEDIPAETTEHSDFVWFVDPLDGTKEFIKQNGQWSIHIGCCYKGTPWAGAVVHPVNQTVFLAGQGRGAFMIPKGKPAQQLNIQSSEKTQPFSASDTKLVVSNSNKDIVTERYIRKVQPFSIKPQGSVGLKASLIAQGQANLYINAAGKCSLWDTCAPEILIRESGGSVETKEGGSINYGDLQQLKVTSTFYMGSREAVQFARSTFQ